MRAPRAYLAGFGTAGSLLAGAAMLFVFASAYVSFHGWPSIGPGPSTALVSVQRTSLPGAAKPGPSLVAAIAASTHVGGAGTGPGGGAASGSGGRPGAGSAGNRLSAGGPSQSIYNRSHRVGAPAGGNPGSGNPGTGPGGLGGIVTQTAGTVGKVVGGAGSTVGHTLGTVSGIVGHVLPPAGGVVGKTGKALGSGLGGLAKSAGSAVSGLGHTVGGLLGGG